MKRRSGLVHLFPRPMCLLMRATRTLRRHLLPVRLCRECLPLLCLPQGPPRL
jgi:hypothetical protein